MENISNWNVNNLNDNVAFGHPVYRLKVFTRPTNTNFAYLLHSMLISTFYKEMKLIFIKCYLIDIHSISNFDKYKIYKYTLMCDYKCVYILNIFSVYSKIFAPDT